jgi:hypothetical protein
MTFGDHCRNRYRVTSGNLAGDRSFGEEHGPVWLAGGIRAVTSNRPSGQRKRIRPLPPGQTLFSPDASPVRAATERRSARPLIFLHQLPTWVAPLVLVGLLIAGLAVRGPVGAVALIGVAAVLSWLASLSWPRLSAQGRLGRVLAVAAMLAVAAYQATR